MTCDCLSVYLVPQEGSPYSFELTPAGTYNGEPYFSFAFDGGTVYLFYAGECFWSLSSSLGGTAMGGLTNCDCPIGSFDLTTPKILEFTVSECTPVVECPCIQITIVSEGIPYTYNVSQTLTFNEYPAYQFYILPISTLQISLWWFSGTWFVGYGDIGNFLASLAFFESDDRCPEGDYTVVINEFGISGLSIRPVECDDCNMLQDRTKREYNAIRLPEIFEEQDRGYFRCCCPFIVMADGSTTTWKNDVTSAWIKLSDPSDTVTAELFDHGVLANYQPTAQAFVNEPNAYYWTIPWKEVLASDGPGCYELKISYNIAGVIQTFTWGIYTLKPYTIENALKTARIRVIFDSQQEIEGINFSGSQVEDSIRFYGYIGNRQPNTEIDNLIYQNREVKKVIRENLNTYEILTDPTCEEHIKKLTDLYLLSENELFISDYNAHNHSYRYLDLPAIVQESPEITYYEFSREASLKCIVGDKFKNKRSYYK